ncbi:MAG: hypothetical protein ABSB79_12910 [Syntrophales bacterium]
MSKKKQNQKQPIEQEDFSRYKDVFDNIEESYVELDLAGNIVFFSGRAYGNELQAIRIPRGY